MDNKEFMYHFSFLLVKTTVKEVSMLELLISETKNLFSHFSKKHLEFSHKSIVSINNTDNLCLARAIAVGLAKFQKEVAKPEDKSAAEMLLAEKG